MRALGDVISRFDKAAVERIARDMIDRTQEGTGALLRAVGPAFSGRDHVTLGALAAGESAAWSRLFNWRTLGTATTAAASALLALRPDCAPETRVGLIAASLGQAAKRGEPTVFGVACVGAQYASFAWALRDARNDAAGWALRAGAWAGGIALAHSRSERLATAVAGIPAAALSALAGDEKLRADKATQGMSHGANLLLASEALTVLNPAEQRQDAGLRGRALDAAQSAAQTVGLVLLVDGLARKGRG